MVSVMRSYSPEDLSELAAGVPGAERYEWQFFYSYSGLSVLLGSKAEKLCAPPLLQWSFFVPRAADAAVDDPTPAVEPTLAVEPMPAVEADQDVSGPELV